MPERSAGTEFSWTRNQLNPVPVQEGVGERDTSSFARFGTRYQTSLHSG